MLTAAALGMAGYGAYSIGWAILDLLRGARLEWWAELALVLFGLLLILSAAFVRVMLPGGLAFALGSLLGLQALAIHDAAHLTGQVALAPQIARGVFALALVLLAWQGSRAVRSD
ncbi:MAG: hypothetical protein KGN76_02705 [Acidobacteriota bacterium]|nr:hypothetical protein [Acidobacteriota bacterium]